MKVGSNVIIADDLFHLKLFVKDYEEGKSTSNKIFEVRDDDCEYRFTVGNGFCDHYALAYLISEPEEKKLKWADLKLGDVIRQKENTISYLVTGIDTSPSTNKHIFANSIWCLDSELEDWQKVEDKE